MADQVPDKKEKPIIKKSPPSDGVARMSLDENERVFCDLYLLKGKAIDAYQAAYADVLKKKPVGQAAITKRAYKLLHSPHIKAYLTDVENTTERIINMDEADVPVEVPAHMASPLAQLRAVMKDLDRHQHEVDIRTQSLKHQMVFEMAMAGGKYSAANAAVVAQSQLHGLLIDRKEVVNRNIVDMTGENLVEELESQQRALVDLGYDPDDDSFKPIE